MIDGRTKTVVSKGKTTSNATIKWWMRKIKGIPQNGKDKISLADITAVTDADKVDEHIIAALKDGRSFRVEAGAGSGKTYSLNRVIE